MRVTVLDSKKVLYTGNAKEVILPGYDGEISILDFHQTFLCCLNKGFIRIIPGIWGKEAGRVSGSLPTVRIQIKKGLAKMVSNELVVMM